MNANQKAEALRLADVLDKHFCNQYLHDFTKAAALLRTLADEIDLLTAERVTLHEDFVTQNKCIADQQATIASLTSERNALLRMLWTDTSKPLEVPNL